MTLPRVTADSPRRPRLEGEESSLTAAAQAPLGAFPWLVLATTTLASTLYRDEHHDRQRRTAAAAGRAGGNSGPNRVDRNLQHRRHRSGHPDDQLAHRALRSAQAHALVSHRFRARLNDVRPRHQPWRVGGLSRLPGCVRGTAGAAVTGDCARGLSQAAACHRDGVLGHGGCIRPDYRPHGRGISVRGARLALGVLHHRTIQRGGACRVVVLHSRHRARRPYQARLGRFSGPIDRACLVPAGARSGSSIRLFDSRA